MNSPRLCRSALSVCATAIVLADCNGSQPPLGVPDATRVAQVSSYHVLHRFRGHRHGDGANPTAGLINVDGTMYGTTSSGGTNHDGTVFSITTTGQEHVLYSFGNGSDDGKSPVSGLLDLNGVLYGTTYSGGYYGNSACRDGCGTVYNVTTAGTETVLLRFAGPSTGYTPAAGVISLNGQFYGTTRGGYGGTVYRVSTTSSEKVLHYFDGSSDGFEPRAGLLNVKGTLYGTTFVGSGTECNGNPSGCGIVYSVSTSGKEKVLYRFRGGSDGANPAAGLIDVKGTLYGTTTAGGSSNNGTVYQISATGAEKVLYSFAGGADGADPEAGVINVNGTLYGTTAAGGSSNKGTVYQIDATGAEKVLYSFAGGSGGANPEAALIDVRGTLYGTTYQGADGYGTVFSLKL